MLAGLPVSKRLGNIHSMQKKANLPPGKAPGRRGSEIRHRLLFPAAGLTGILMVLSFPRYGQDYLIWITLVPLFWGAIGAGPRRGFLAGWFAGLTLTCGGFNWLLYAMREFSGLGWPATFLFLPWLLFESLPWGLLGLSLGILHGGGRLRGAGPPVPVWALAAIPLWVALEHIYPRLFPWQLGGALYQRTLLIQCADLLGAGGLTALILLVNVTIFLVLAWLEKLGRFPLRSLLVTLILVFGANLYGWLRLEHVDARLSAARELKVGMVQPSFSPEEKRANNLQDATILFNQLDALTRALHQREPLDLAIWPEGVDRIGYLVGPGGKLHRRIIDKIRPTGFENLPVPLIAGTFSVSSKTEMPRNTAEYVIPGKWPPGLYHKNKLVLFGEYVPFWNLLPEGVRSKLRNVGVLEAGTECPIFELSGQGGPYQFRMLICYEGILSGYVRKAARRAGGGEIPDFLVNVTEDYWYGKTSHIEQHLLLLVMRAVENRISIARCANAGPSGVIDPAGRMVERTTPFESCEKALTLRPVRLNSFYATFGFAFPWVCLAGAVFLFVRLPGRRRDAR